MQTETTVTTAAKWWQKVTVLLTLILRLLKCFQMNFQDVLVLLPYFHIFVCFFLICARKSSNEGKQFALFHTVLPSKVQVFEVLRLKHT